MCPSLSRRNAACASKSPELLTKYYNLIPGLYMSLTPSHPIEPTASLSEVKMPVWALGDNDPSWDIARLEILPLLHAKGSAGGKGSPAVNLEPLLEKINFYIVQNIYAKGLLIVEEGSPKWNYIVAIKAISLRLEEGWVLPGEERFKDHVISKVFVEALTQFPWSLNNFEGAVNFKNSLLDRPNMPIGHIEQLLLNVGNPFDTPVIKAHPEAEQHARAYVKLAGERIKNLPQDQLEACVQKLVWSDLGTLLNLKTMVSDDVFYEALLSQNGGFKDVESGVGVTLDEAGVEWICRNLRDNHLQAVDCFIRWGVFNGLITTEFESAFVRVLETKGASVPFSFETQAFLPHSGIDARAVLVDSLMNPNRASFGLNEGEKFNGCIESVCRSDPSLSEAAKIGLLMRSYYPAAKGASQDVIAALESIEPDFSFLVKRAGDRTELLGLLLPHELVDGAKLVFSGFPPEDARIVHSLIHSKVNDPAPSPKSGPDIFDFELNL